MSGTEEAPLHILFVHENNGTTGGAETNIQITAEELKARGHRLALVYGSPTQDAAWIKRFPERYEVGNFTSQGSNFTECSISKTETQPFHLHRILDEFQPDVIYVHKLTHLDLFQAVLECGVPVVRMVHDHEMYCLRQYKYNPLTRAVCHRSASAYCVFPCLAQIARNRTGGFPIKFASFKGRQREMELTRRCDQTVVYSDYSKAELVQNGFDPARIHIHVPIRCWGHTGPVSSFSPRNLILFAGQIIRGKGVDLLIKAMSKLTVPFEAIFLGDGSHRPFCEKLSAKLGLTKHTKFVGYVPHDQMRHYYLEASVFAMPSVWPEPFGMAGPEAMRYGLPVVAFDAGGISEWLTDGCNGFLAPWMDVEVFAARLQLLLTDKSLARKMGKRAIQDVNGRFDSHKQLTRLESLFFHVAKGGCTDPECRRSPTPARRDGAELFNLGERQSVDSKHKDGAVSVEAL